MKYPNVQTIKRDSNKMNDSRIQNSSNKMNNLWGQQQRLKETRIAWDRVISENEFNNIKYIFKYNYGQLIILILQKRKPSYK